MKHAAHSGLSLAQWGNIAQIALAAAAIGALWFAWREIRAARDAACRQRVYDYADTFNSLDILKASARHRERWPNWTVGAFRSLPKVERSEWLRLPNLIEEVAHLYNQNALDRDIAAELLGLYAEKLWESSQKMITELRAADQNPQLYLDWERMQIDTLARRVKPQGERVDPAGPSVLRGGFSAEYRRENRMRWR